MNKIVYTVGAVIALAYGCATSQPSVEQASVKSAPKLKVRDFVAREKQICEDRVAAFVDKQQFLEAAEYLRDYSFDNSNYNDRDTQVIDAALKAVRITLMKDRVIEGLWIYLEAIVCEEFYSQRDANGWQMAIAFAEACPSAEFKSKNSRLFSLMDEDVLGCKVLYERLKTPTKSLVQDAIKEITEKQTAVIKEKFDAFVAEKQFSEAAKYLRDYSFDSSEYSDKDAKLMEDASKAVCSELMNSIVKEVVDAQTVDIVEKVDAAIARNDIIGARRIVNEWPKIGIDQADRALVAVRIGIMNYYVNWRDYQATSAAFKKLVPDILPENVDELCKLEALIDEYDMCRVDTYIGVGEAVSQVVSELVALKYLPEEYEDKIKQYRDAIQRFLDGRSSEITERQFRDWTKFDEAMENVREAIAYHWIERFPKQLKVERDPLTTAAMNGKLAELKNETLNNIRGKIYIVLAHEQAQRVAEEQVAFNRKTAEAFRRAMNGLRDQIDLESQVAKAEHAFSKMSIGGHVTQHEIVDFVPVLTEYSRVLRALAANQRITKEDATAMLIGGAYVGELRVMKWAVRLGADVDGHVIIDGNKTTALMVALLRNEFEAFEYLSSPTVGASFSVKDARDRTAIFYAVEGGDLSLLRLTILKSEVNVVDNEGMRPVFLAAKWNRLKLFELLIDNNADIGDQAAPILIKSDDSIVEYASKHGAIKVLDYLYEHGWTASTAAVVKSILAGQLASVKWHVEHGARVDAPEISSAISLHLWNLQKESCMCPICEYLVHRGVKLR